LTGHATAAARRDPLRRRLTARSGRERLHQVGAGTAVGVGAAYLVFTRLQLAWSGFIGADGARDLAIALRLVHGEEIPLRGPLFGMTFHLGPLYYYLVAIPLGLFHTATAVTAVLTLLNLSAVYFGYRVARTLFDRRTGILFACLLAGDFVAASAVSQLSNVSLVLPLTLWLLDATLGTIVHRDPRWLALALPLAGAAVQIHPTVAALFPLLLVACLVPTRRGKATSVTLGIAGAAILSAPFLLYELTHQGENVRRILGMAMSVVRRASAAPLLAIPDLFRWVLLVGPGTASRLSDGLTPLWLRNVALVALYAVAAAALAGLSLVIVGLFRQARPRSSALIVTWLLPWWLITPAFASPITWWHLYPIQPALLLSAALALARLGDRLPRMRRSCRSLPYTFAIAAFVLPAWLAMATFQRAADRGLLLLPASLFWEPGGRAQGRDPFRFPSIGLRREERLMASLLQETGCSPSLLHRLHGLPLWLTLQSRGILLRLHQPLCRRGPASQDAVAVLGVRASDLPPPLAASGEPAGPVVLFRQRAPAILTQVRVSERVASGWPAPGFDDSRWRPLALPAVRMPDPTAYPPRPDMAWPRSPVYLRARLRYAGAGSAMLGVAFPSAAPWLYQGRVEALFVNGRPAPPPRLQAPDLLLYDLGPVLVPGENLVGLAVGGAPDFTLDLFVLTAAHRHPGGRRAPGPVPS